MRHASNTRSKVNLTPPQAIMTCVQPQRSPAWPRVRRALATLACLTALALVACDSGLLGLGGGATPLATLRVQLGGDIVRWSAVQPARKAKRLRAGLIWAATWNPEDLCSKYHQWLTLGPVAMPLEASLVAVGALGCPDLLGFVAAASGPSAAVDAKGQAAIEIAAPPSAEWMVGSPNGRIAYATVVLFDDRNGNELLDLEYSAGDGMGDRGARWEVEEPDLVLSASFVTMASSHVRLVFREGAYIGNSTFFPLVNCAAPPMGFGVARVEGPLGHTTCTYQPVAEAVIELRAQPPHFAASTACVGHGPWYSPATQDDKPKSISAVYCLSANELLEASGLWNLCKGLTHYQLRGCLNDKACEDPAWEYPHSVPTWWPCGDPRARK